MNVLDGASAVARNDQWEGLLEANAALFIGLLLLIYMAVKRRVDWRNYRDYCGHFLKLYNRNEFQFIKYIKVKINLNLVVRFCLHFLYLKFIKNILYTISMYDF